MRRAGARICFLGPLHPPRSSCFAFLPALISHASRMTPQPSDTGHRVPLCVSLSNLQASRTTLAFWVATQHHGRLPAGRDVVRRMGRPGCPDFVTESLILQQSSLKLPVLRRGCTRAGITLPAQHPIITIALARHETQSTLRLPVQGATLPKALYQYEFTEVRRRQKKTSRHPQDTAQDSTTLPKESIQPLRASEGCCYAPSVRAASHRVENRNS